MCLVKFPENFSTEMPPAISWLQILMSDLFIPLDSHGNIQEKKFYVGNVVVGNDFELKSWELSHQQMTETALTFVGKGQGKL